GSGALPPGAHDVPGPPHLPSRRPAREGGPGGHGGIARDPRADARPPRGRARVAPAPFHEDRRGEGQARAAAAAGAPRPRVAFRAAEDGLRHSARGLAARAPARLGRDAARRAAPCRRGLLRSAQSARDLGRASFRTAQLAASALGRADVRRLARAREARVRRLLYFVADDWYFCSHRLALGRSARAAGYRVGVVTRVRSHAGPIKDAGLELFPVELARAGMNPLADLAAVRAVTRIYRDFRPDIVHHVAMKPVLYGTLAARRADVPCIVNALAGLGWMFSSRDAAARLLKPFVLAAFRRLLNRAGSGVVVQNPDDHRLMAKRAGVADGRIAVIRGSGVDLEAFPATAPPEGLPL